MCCLCCSLEYLYSWSFILEFEPPGVVEADSCLQIFFGGLCIPQPPGVLRVVFYSSRSFSRLLWFLMYLFQVVCTSSRFFLNLYVPHPGCFLFIRVVSRLLWFLMYLFQVVCTSSRFFLILYVPHPGCFLINPSSFLS